MIPVGTAIWIEHRRIGDVHLTALLQDGQVLAHPWVIGELALGQLTQRNEIIGLVRHLPSATVATDAEMSTMIEKRHVFGIGIGYVDAHLLAATLLTAGATLWTSDKRLAAVAATLGLTGQALPKLYKRVVRPSRH